MKRRILLVDDEVAVLLTMKAILEISGFEVDTAASSIEGRKKLKAREYQMVITDMRMESDEAGRQVIQAARTANYHPAVALLTAFPVAEEDWQDMGADRMLVKPMQTRALLRQIEMLLETHAAKLAKLSAAAKGPSTPASASATTGNSVRKASSKNVPSKKTPAASARKPPLPARKTGRTSTGTPAAKSPARI